MILSTNADGILAAVTGAGGFIGSHLVRELIAQGARVRAMVRYRSGGEIGHLAEELAAARARGEDWLADGRLEIFHGDVLDARSVRGLVEGCDWVFHLAALIGIPYSYRAPESYLDVNARGGLNVLEACRESSPKRIIFTSTSEVYGTALFEPMTEEHPLRAQSPYAASKIASDKIAESYALSFGTPVTILRPFNTYGPRQSLRAVIPTILAQAMSPEIKEIRLGDVRAARDVTFVEDTAAGFVALARAPIEETRGRAYNLGTGKTWTVGELAALSMRVAGVEKPVRLDQERVRPAESEVRRLIADATELAAVAGWRPRVALEEGLRRTAEWLRPRLDGLDAAAYRV